MHLFVCSPIVRNDDNENKNKHMSCFCTLLFQLNFALFEKVYLSKFIGKTEGLFFGRVDHARRVEVCFGGGGRERRE